MRIALISPLVSPIREPNLGGAQAVVSDLARELSRRDHDVLVYAARGSGIAGVAIAPVDIDAERLSGDIIRPGADHPPSPAMVDTYRAVYEDVARQRFDIVHNHGFDTPAITAAASSGVPVLHTLHMPPNHAVAAALRAGRRSSRLWCAVVSHAQRAAWRELTTVDGVLRNGVPLDRIRFAAGTGSGAVIAARYSAEKGIAEGIAAARAAGLAVSVFGIPYDDAYERGVRERWRGDAGVRLHSAVGRETLWVAFGAAEVVVCLSQWDEPFGMVAAEAQAAGTPVVAASRGGLPEVIRDGVTGVLVERREPGAAADAVIRARALRRSDCRHHAQTSLGLARAVDAHEEMYSRIAAL